jgi:hypothetical protein
MDPRVLVEACAAIDLPAGGLVADPFCGSNRVGSFVVGRGERFLGIEAHPLIAEQAAVKLTRPGDPADFRATADRLVRVATKLARDVVAAHEHALVRRWLTDAPLRKLVAIRSVLTADAGPWEAHLLVALLAVLRETVIGWPGGNPRACSTLRDPFTRYLVRVGKMADDLEQAPRSPVASVICADSRAPGAWADVPSGSVSACVSSPPYLNQLCYAESMRLELYFLRRASTWAELRLLGANLVASATQQVCRSRAEEARGTLDELPQAADRVAALATLLDVERRRRARRKRYDLLLPCYVADMAAVMRHLKRVLAPSACVAWIVGDSAWYGIHIDTPALVTTIAADLGFRVDDDRAIRRRGLHWPDAPRRHSLPLSEHLVLLRQGPPAAEQQLLFDASQYQPAARISFAA